MRYRLPQQPVFYAAACGFLANGYTLECPAAVRHLYVVIGAGPHTARLCAWECHNCNTNCAFRVADG